MIDYVRENTDIVELFGLPRGFLLNDISGLPQGREEHVLDGDRIAYSRWIETPRGRIDQVVDYSRAQRLSMVRKPWVETRDDLEKVLSIPERSVRPDLSAYRERRASIGERGICLPEIPCAASFVHELLDTEGLALWSREERGTVLELLDRFNARLMAYVRYLLEHGVGPVLALLGEEYITPPLHSPLDFQEFVVAYDKPIVEAIHEYGVICRIHCHGRIGRLLDGFLDIGVDALHPVEEPPMGDLTLQSFRKRAGNRICIKGGVQIGDLYEKNAAEVAAHCRGVIERAGRCGALILAPSASPYWPELTPAMFDNYRAMIDSVHECEVSR
ncbi:MAG: hypothetical protein M5U26_12780 [Planctomycetota bacterium]|nr:hypothetical protein [Planctomycetota bacterium]